MAAFPRLVQMPPRAPHPDLATAMPLINTANLGTRFPRDIVNFPHAINSRPSRLPCRTPRRPPAFTAK
jgi:hypothetical protein